MKLGLRDWKGYSRPLDSNEKVDVDYNTREGRPTPQYKHSLKMFSPTETGLSLNDGPYKQQPMGQHLKPMIKEAYLDEPRSY